MVRRSYSGVAPATTLNGAISAVDTTLLVASGSGYPTGTVGPFVICIDAGLATEEKILVDDLTGATMTVAVDGRGYDGTSALDHADGAPITHVWSAQDATDTAEHIDSPDNVHGVGPGSDVVGTDTVQTLTGKTIDTADNDIAVAMADVTGLGAQFAAVDAALDGKAPASGIAQSAVTGLVTDLADLVAADEFFNAALTGGLNSKQAKRAICVAGRSSDYTISDSSIVKIAFTTTLVETTPTMHDPAGNNTRLYARTAGVYEVKWAIECVGTLSINPYVTLYKNGTNLLDDLAEDSWQAPGGGYNLLINGFQRMQLAADDYVEIGIKVPNDASTTTLVRAESTFSIEQVVA